MAQRATNQNPFVVLLPPVPRFLVLGANIYIYIYRSSIRTSSVRSVRYFKRKIGQPPISRKDEKDQTRSSRGESLGSRDSWVEIIDIDSGRITMTRRRVERAEFGVGGNSQKKK